MRKCEREYCLGGRAPKTELGGTRQGITVSYCALLLDFLFVHYVDRRKIKFKKRKGKISCPKHNWVCGKSLAISRWGGCGGR